MVPAAEGAALEVVEVVEPEFTFEVLVHALGSPALFDDANEFLVAHPTRQCRQEKPGTLGLVRLPLDDQPRWLALRDGDAVLVQRVDAAKAEAGAQRTLLVASPLASDAIGSTLFRSAVPNTPAA